MKFSRIFFTYKKLTQNYIQKKGKFQRAFKQFSKVSSTFKRTQAISSVSILRKATGNAQPFLYLRSNKRGRKAIQYPVFYIDRRQGLKKGFKMLFNKTSSKVTSDFIKRSVLEIIDASRKRGSTVQQVNALHRLAFSLKFNRFYKKGKKLTKK